MPSDALPVGQTLKDRPYVIGAEGKAPKGVRTDDTGTRARSVKAAKPQHGRTDDLKPYREIRVMLGHKVPYPRVGDRRTLIRKGTPGGKMRGPRDSMTFAVVEYAGNTCVKVHGATDDYRQAISAAETVARDVKRWLNREIVRNARKNGASAGREITVKVVDRTGLMPSERKPRKAKAVSLERPEPKIKRRDLSADELAQKHHRIDRNNNRPCRECGESSPANYRCGSLVKVDTLAEAFAATAQLRGE